MKKLLLLFAFAFPAFGQLTNVNIGTTPNDQTGDTLRAAMIKLNWNDNYLLNAINELVMPDSGITATVATNIAAYQAYIATNDLNAALLAVINTKQPSNVNLTIWSGRTTNEFYLASNPSNFVTLAVLQAATNGTYTVLHQEKIDATNAIYAKLITAITSATNNLDASKVLYGTIPLARLSGITSNQIAAATDAAYRQDNVGVSLEQLQHATNNLSAQRLVDGTVPLTRLSGITSNQIDAATDAAYRATGSGGTAYPPFTMLGYGNFFSDYIGSGIIGWNENDEVQSYKPFRATTIYGTTINGTTYEAASGFKGFLRANSGYGSTWLYDHTGGASIAEYDGTTISASVNKKWGGDGSALTGIQWSVASSWTSNALARVLPNGNGYFGGGQVTISDEGVFAPLFSGSGAQLTSLNAGNLSSGQVPPARLATGTASNGYVPKSDGAGGVSWQAVGSGTGTNYVDSMYTVAGDPWFANAGGGIFTWGAIGSAGGTITTSTYESRVDVDGILYVDDGIEGPYVKAAAGAGGGFKVGEDEGITDTITIYARNSSNTGTVTHTVVIKGGIITSWTQSP